MTIDPVLLAAWQALNRAIRADDLPAVRTQVDEHPEFLGDQPKLGSALILAAKLGRLAIVEYFVQKGADIDQTHSSDDSPICAAARYGRVEVVEYLIRRGAKLDVSNLDRNPLFACVHDGHAEVAKLLVDAGIDCHAVYRLEERWLRNALEFAQSRGQTKIADLLVTAGCRPPIEAVEKRIRRADSADQGRPEDNSQQIITRMAKAYAPVDPLALQEIVPVLDDVHVAINVIPPCKGHPCLTIFTTGMSSRPMKTPPGQEAHQYAELLIHLPADWPHPRAASADDHAALWPVKWLRQLAYFPHLHDTWLGGKTTIISSDEPPVPLGANTKQTCLLLLADFVKCSPMLLDDGKTVWMYLVYPIYTEERDFEKTHGMAELLQRLQDRGYGAITNVDRANVAID
jgi:hypothetical protein